MSLLQVDSVSYQYGRGTPFARTALDRVSFGVEKGELIAVIGHTGSGKSTLMQMLNALLRPDSGSVLFNGADVHKDKNAAYQTRFHVGLCFQYPEYQLFGETCAEDIAFGPRNMGLPEEEVKRRVEAAAGYVKLEKSCLSRSPFDLSGGQKRKCAIAGVLAMEPEVLILDEPTAGLDPEGRRGILSLIASYRETTGAAVVFVTHSMEAAAAYAERILVLDHGKLILDGAPDVVFSNAAQLEAAGLRLPVYSRILRALQIEGFPLKDAYTLDAAADAVAAFLHAEGKL